MGRVNQLGLESKHKDYRPHNTSFDVRARLNVNDLIEKRKQEKNAKGEIETEHPGYLGSQDTYYVGHFKGVGKDQDQTRWGAGKCSRDYI